MSEYFGYDCMLQINGADIVQVRDIEGPGLKMDTVEVTTRDLSLIHISEPTRPY